MVAANVGVPVSQMDDTYVRESATLSEAIIKYGTLDLYDPQRVQVINVRPYLTPHACQRLQAAAPGAGASVRADAGCSCSWKVQCISVWCMVIATCPVLCSKAVLHLFNVVCCLTATSSPWFAARQDLQQKRCPSNMGNQPTLPFSPPPPPLSQFIP